MPAIIIFMELHLQKVYSAELHESDLGSRISVLYKSSSFKEMDIMARTDKLSHGDDRDVHVHIDKSEVDGMTINISTHSELSIVIQLLASSSLRELTFR